MWCCQCQQDVPAVGAVGGSPSCPRCQTRLQRPQQSAAAFGRPADAGISLDAFDQPTAAATPVCEMLDAQRAGAELRRIGRLLRPKLRLDPGHFQFTPLRSRPPVEEPMDGVSGAVRDAAGTLETPVPPRRPSPAWGLSLLLATGGAAFALGVTLLAAASATARPAAWQAGMTATVTGEGLLIIGLAWMATRLWRNSRRLNRKLDGVDRQLDEIQYAAGQLAHARMSASHTYYEHFAAAASPPLALANLRGQLDQLAARIGVA